MKRIYLKKIILSLLLTVASVSAYSFEDGPPNPGGNPSGNETPLGGGAPLGESVFILLSLGAAYGVRKVYNLKKEKLEE